MAKLKDGTVVEGSATVENALTVENTLVVKGDLFLEGRFLHAPSLSEASWETIDFAANSFNTANELFSIGDEKTIVVNGETLTLQIYDFNHDDLSGGGKAKITFGLKNCMSNTRPMNTPDTNVNGWDGSDMRTWANGTLYNSLPSDLRAVIKPVIKKATSGSPSFKIINSTDKVFLFSRIEVGQSTFNEGELYPIFTDNNSRIKQANGSASAWWLRSPSPGYSNRFSYVSISGADGNGFAGYSQGVVFGFCV